MRWINNRYQHLGPELSPIRRSTQPARDPVRDVDQMSTPDYDFRVSSDQLRR